MAPTSTLDRGGPFYLHIEGLPSNYTWQDLKDLIRERARHGVWTDMVHGLNGRGDGRGSARIQRYREVLSVFDALSNGTLINRPLYMHLFDISKSPPQMLKCNCPNPSKIHQQPQIAEEYFKFATLAGDPRSWRDLTPPQGSSPYSAQPNFQYAPAYATSGLSPPVYQNDFSLSNGMQGLAIQQRTMPTATQPQIRAYPPINLQTAGQGRDQYVASSGGIPTNVSQGYAVTEHRGIHVRNLDYKLSKDDIIRKFGKVGYIVECKRETDQAGKFKGYATIRYSTAREAAQAQAEFNGLEWRGRTLQVKLDKNATVVRAPATSSTPQQSKRSTVPPIIVNGSSGYQVG